MVIVNLNTQQTSIKLVTNQTYRFGQQAPVKRTFNVSKQLKRQQLAIYAEQGTQQEPDKELLSDTELAKRKAENLRQQEREQIVIGDGTAKCQTCGYIYQPGRGDQDNLVPKGTKFNDVPSDYSCPICGAPKIKFQSDLQKVPGFAANQGYGLGVNRMTSNNKSILIFGSLLAFFALFIAGYNMS